VTAELFFEALDRVLRARRVAFTHQVKIGIALTEGIRYVIDLGAEDVVTRGWSDSADAFMLTNLSTLEDWMAGKLDLAHPRPGQLLICSGSRDAMRDFQDALGGGTDIVALRSSAQANAKPAKKKRRKAKE
jgi:hypothetical protein